MCHFNLNVQQTTTTTTSLSDIEHVRENVDWVIKTKAESIECFRDN